MNINHRQQFRNRVGCRRMRKFFCIVYISRRLCRGEKVEVTHLHDVFLLFECVFVEYYPTHTHSLSLCCDNCL
jgi:hypothetical protein